MPSGWRIPQNIGDWMRTLEKRVMAVERRPVVHSAADLMGPSLGPYARHLTDCNADEATFNGFYHIHLAASNSPDTTIGWMGHTIAEANGYGVQIAYPVHTNTGALTTGSAKIRRFYVPGGHSPRIYGAWNTL